MSFKLKSIHFLAVNTFSKPSNIFFYMTEVLSKEITVNC